MVLIILYALIIVSIVGFLLFLVFFGKRFEQQIIMRSIYGFVAYLFVLVIIMALVAFT